MNQFDKDTLKWVLLGILAIILLIIALSTNEPVRYWPVIQLP